MTRTLGRLAAVLACAAWWSVWFSLRAFGLLLAASAALFVLAEAIEWAGRDCGFDETPFGDWAAWEDEIAGGGDGRGV